MMAETTADGDEYRVPSLLWSTRANVWDGKGELGRRGISERKRIWDSGSVMPANDNAYVFSVRNAKSA
jgi:hypothetical protein